MENNETRFGNFSTELPSNDEIASALGDTDRYYLPVNGSARETMGNKTRSEFEDAVLRGTNLIFSSRVELIIESFKLALGHAVIGAYTNSKKRRSQRTRGKDIPQY